MNIEMVDLKSQYERIKPEVDKAIQEVIDSTAFINGEPVKLFAEELAEYLGAAHVIPCASGTDALQIALMALGLKPGDEIITTPFTFVATAEVIALLQLKPVFVDIDPDTFNINASQIEEKITDKSKCIIPVHLYGQSADMERIMQIAKKHKLYVIEDNAQAIGADYTFPDGAKKKAGAIADIGCTSFFPSKNLGCYGDGGAISTNDKALAEEMRIIINHGQREKYKAATVGVNSRLDTIQAAILRCKLPYLDKYIKARQKAAEFYNEAFKDIEEINTPKTANFSTHVFHQYTLKLAEGIDRDEIKQQLAAAGIPAMVYYPIPLHLQAAYKSFGYSKGDYPISEEMAERVLSLPMHTELKEEQLKYITEQLINCFKKEKV